MKLGQHREHCKYTMQYNALEAIKPTMSKAFWPLPAPNVAQVYVTKWWMMHYGAPTAKREHGMSNAVSALLLDLGKLSRKEMEAKTTHKLAKTSVNASGKKQWTGVRKSLKESQSKPRL